VQLPNRKELLWRFTIGAAASAFGCRPAFGQDNSTRTASTSSFWTVPAFFGDRVIVSAMLDGRAAWLHLDTGTSTLALSSEALALGGASSRPESPVHAPIEIEIGAYKDVIARYSVLDYHVVDTGRRLSGIIGAPFFEKFGVFIDFKSKQVLATESDRSFADANNAHEEPLHVIGRVPYVDVLFGQVAARMLLDTGAAQTVLFAPVAKVVQIGRQTDEQPLPLGFGLKPTAIRGTSTLPLRWGPANIERPYVYVPDVPPKSLTAAGADGILGRDILRTLPFALDYSRGVAYI
jgi:hypothetical protein